MTGSPPENPLLAAWEETLARRANEPAILLPSGPVARTFAELEAEAHALEPLFAGCPAHSVVGIQLGNAVSWPALLLVLFRARLIPLPLSEAMSTTERERALAVCGAVGWIERVGEKMTLQMSPTNVSHEPEDLIRARSGVSWTAPAPDFLKLTSGTTGAPRAVRFRAAQLVADCDQICATMGLSDCDLNFGVIPFSHSYGFSNLLTPLLCRGVPLVASDDRLPRAILHGLAQTGATIFPATPLFFQKLAEVDDAPPLPALRLCISAGSPLRPMDGERFTKKFGLKVHAFYGSSECGGISYDAADAVDYREGFAGTAMGGVEIVPQTEGVGPISVRSAAVGDSYFPENESAVLGGGRFIPGDLVRCTSEGLFLTGRASEVINVAGQKLNPLEVEARLADFPGVRAAVVFGVASRLRGEEPIACIVGEGICRELLLRFCHERLSAWQVPRDVWMVSEIPVDERGKISRRTLAERYQQRALP